MHDEWNILKSVIYTIPRDEQD